MMVSVTFIRAATPGESSASGASPLGRSELTRMLESGEGVLALSDGGDIRLIPVRNIQMARITEEKQ